LEIVLRGGGCGGRLCCVFAFGKTMKYIFIDLDGTLFNNKKGISAANLNALELAKKNGIVPVICSGRSLSRIESIGLKVDFFIFNNGGGIYDCKKRKVVYECCMRPESVDAVRALCNKYKVELLIHETNGGDYSTSGKKYSNAVAGGKVVQMIPLSTDYDIMRKIIAEVKTIPYVYVPNQSKHITDPTFPIDLTHVDGEAYCDINDENCSKGNGILKFAEIYGAKKEDCIAIGDDMNDITMFDACGYNVAMGNAIKSLKERADFITDTNENDGVAKFIARLITHA
jgi:Cof subfamily protein (haloacid dehalogenase superfamily)